MKVLNRQHLVKVCGGLNAAECASDAVGGFGIGATVGGAIGAAAGAAGAAIGAGVGGLIGGAAAVSNNAACGTGDAASSSACAASASCSAAATSCSASDGVGGGGGGGSKVICTELCRQGAIDIEIWKADLRYSQQHFSACTLRGYHLWGIPFVRLMRRYPVLAALVLPPTRWFAEDIAYRMGVRPTPNWKGWVLREMCFRPLCSALGQFTRPRDASVLWGSPDASR